MVTIVIIGILAIISIGTFNGFQEKARDVRVQYNVEQITKAVILMGIEQENFVASTEPVPVSVDYTTISASASGAIQKIGLNLGLDMGGSYCYDSGPGKFFFTGKMSDGTFFSKGTPLGDYDFKNLTEEQVEECTLGSISYPFVEKLVFLEEEDGGGWNTWGEWEKCSVMCGTGTKYRKRTCSLPENDCEGSSIEYENCGHTCVGDKTFTFRGNYMHYGADCQPGSDKYVLRGQPYGETCDNNNPYPGLLTNYHGYKQYFHGICPGGCELDRDAEGNI